MRNEEQQIPAACGSYSLVSSGAVLLMAFLLRKVWTMVEELFINLELLPLSPPPQQAELSEASISISSHVVQQLCINSPAPWERRAVLKWTNVLQDVFSWWNKATGKALMWHSIFVCRFGYLFWNTIVMSPIPASPSAHYYREQH